MIAPQGGRFDRDLLRLVCECESVGGNGFDIATTDFNDDIMYGNGTFIQLYGTEGRWGCYVVEVPAAFAGRAGGVGRTGTGGTGGGSATGTSRSPPGWISSARGPKRRAALRFCA